MKIFKTILKYAVLVAFLFIAAMVTSFFVHTPSNDRNWSRDLATLAYAEINGPIVKIHNIRNSRYRTTEDFDLRYYDKTFDLRKLKGAWYMVEPFGPITGPAHTFVTFDFEGNDFLSISIEVRREKGEQFGLSRTIGFGRPDELIYVVADENDVIKLRSNYRKDIVRLYPIEFDDPKDMANLFMAYINKVNKLAVEPEFYNLFTNTCTTNIADHVNEATGAKVPFSWKYIFPAYSDELAYDLDLFDTKLSLEEARAYYQINERAEKYANDPLFSVKIRPPRK